MGSYGRAAKPSLRSQGSVLSVGWSGVKVCGLSNHSSLEDGQVNADTAAENANSRYSECQQ